mgnify:CR=1 FL=1
MRIGKDRYYLNIAKEVSKRSPCLRRKVGAIIVKNDVILSTGYNGPPRGSVNCDEVGCIKEMLKAPHGSAYELCPAVHAEENAIINAARQGVSILGGTLYLAGEYLVETDLEPATVCERCKRAIINAGIVRVVTLMKDGRIKEFNVKDWVRNDIWNYLKKITEIKMKKTL